MKLAALLCLSLFLPSCSGQTTAPMSPAFTTLALKSLRLFSVDYRLTTAESLKQAVDSLGDVSDAARTKSEIAIAASLGDYAEAILKNKNGRAKLVENSWSAWERAHPNANDEFKEQARKANEEIVLSRQIVIRMSEKEEACRYELDSILRSGKYRTVSHCSDVRVDEWDDLKNR